ncbi:hypothetical protein [Pseudorhodoplanes sp.]|uniref:hypothetical protein n=1 Tax=Pseudorhodoplanes sp. TaxID=1934341 RepID=UPI003D0BF1E1
MSAKAPGFFDTFTGDEAALMETIIADLKDVAWAKPILDDIDKNGGLKGANMPRFFELRQGYALHKAGITLSYEIAGEGESTIDFGFQSGGLRWNVEMLRLTETEAARGATTTGVDEHGMQWARRVLSGSNKDKRQSPEGETLKAIERLCQKCEKDGQPYKFPPAGSRTVNALLVDFRTFSTRGGDVADRLHVGLGGSMVPHALRMYWGEGENRKLITGVFDPHTTLKGSKEARERLHLIGFVNQRSFGSADYAAAIQFIANPHLIQNWREARAVIETWPLKPRTVLNRVT